MTDRLMGLSPYASLGDSVTRGVMQSTGEWWNVPMGLDQGGDAGVAAAAANVAAWHDVCVRAIGLRPRMTDRWWTCPTPAPNIYHTAISLRPARNRRDRAAMLDELADHVEHPDSAHLSVCDSWDELPADRLGLQRRGNGPWFARPPGPLPEMTDPRPPAALEDRSGRGCGGTDRLRGDGRRRVRGAAPHRAVRHPWARAAR